MKIMFVTPYYAPKVGGLERYAQTIAEGLAVRHHDVYVVASGDTAKRETINGVKVIRLKTRFTLANTPLSPSWPNQLRTLIKTIQPDVINVHAPVPSLALATSLVAGRTPLVVTYHTGSMAKGVFAPDVLIAGYEKLFLPQMLRRANAIITASSYVADGFLAGYKNKATVITPGVDINRFVPNGKAVKNRLVFVGDFRDPRKGLSVLIEAVRQTPKASLVVVGPGTARPEARISYTGSLGTDALISELQQASILVLPSTTANESFGMVIVEALACGVPVIASRVGGIPAVLDDGITGRLVPPLDSSALATAITQMLENPTALAKMGQTGRKTAVQRYNWDSRIEATAQVFNRVARKQSPTAQELHHAKA